MSPAELAGENWTEIFKRLMVPGVTSGGKKLKCPDLVSLSHGGQVVFQSTPDLELVARMADIKGAMEGNMNFKWDLF